MRYFILISIFLVLNLSAQSFPFSENSWQNKDFVKRFLGEYGVLNKIRAQN